MDMAKPDNKISELTILCFGDSNTYGQRPDAKARYSPSQRWTRRLSTHLSDRYHVTEEGLGGRRTDLEHPDSTKPSKNGWTYFPPCIASHDPAVVIIMLGTNDAQIAHGRSADEITTAVERYILHCRSLDIIPLLVAPVAPDQVGLFDETVIPKELWNFNEQSVDTLKELPEKLRSLAASYGIPFFDANSCVQVGADGLHWTHEGHAAFAKAISIAISEITI